MEDPNETVRRRLLAIELARDLGSVAEACRRTGIDRTSFYDWRRRFKREGVAGLADRPPVHHSHPQTTPAELAERVAALALAHPSYGCNRLAQLLSGEGRAISSTTIQKILSAADLGTRHDRWLALDVPEMEQKFPLTQEQQEFLEQMNPCWRDRSGPGTRPGTAIVAGAIEIPCDAGRTIFVHFAIDLATGLACADLWWIRDQLRIVQSIWQLRDLFQAKGYSEQPELCIAYGHHTWFRSKIRNLSWRVERQPITTAEKVGAFERFAATLRREFSPLLVQMPEVLGMHNREVALKHWLDVYNTQRPLDGYPNYGAAPAKAFLRGVRKEA